MSRRRLHVRNFGKAFPRVRNNFKKVYEADIADLMCSVYLHQYILFSLVTENELSELLI